MVKDGRNAYELGVVSVPRQKFPPLILHTYVLSFGRVELGSDCRAVKSDVLKVDQKFELLQRVNSKE